MFTFAQIVSVEWRDEPAVLDLEQRVDREQAVTKRLGAGDLEGWGDLGRVVDAELHPGQLGAQQLGPHSHPAGDRGAGAVLGLEAELPQRALVRPCQLGEADGAELEAPFEAAVAGAGGLQEAHRGAQLGLRTGLQSALEPRQRMGRRLALRVGGRIDDPERGRGGVLGRARRVGVEGIALVEQRADQLLDAFCAHPRSPPGARGSPPASSSSSTAAS